MSQLDWYYNHHEQGALSSKPREQKLHKDIIVLKNRKVLWAASGQNWALHGHKVSTVLIPIHAFSKACMWVTTVALQTLFINKNNRHSVCLKSATLSPAGETEDSPGPAPAPDPELVPSDLSSDWPTGREGGMVNMKIQGMEDEGRRGSNSENHTQGLVAYENVWSHRAARQNVTTRVRMSKASMPLK